MIYKEPKKWTDTLPLTLLAYPTSMCTLTQAMAFSLVYGAEIVVPIELMVPSARLAFRSNNRSL